MMCYIEYLNAEEGHRLTRRIFMNFDKAEAWGRKQLSNFSYDMIHLLK